MIFYFSATGNSKHIAEKIANATNDKTVNIADCVRDGLYSFDLAEDEKAGFIIPVYYFNIPIIVAEFLSKIKISAKDSYYSYVVLNCGGTTGNAEYYLNRVYKPSALFGVLSVDNYVPMSKLISEAEITEQLAKTELEIENVVKHIQNKDSGTFNSVKGRVPCLMSFIAYPFYKHGRRTKRFKVSNSCTGCGLCEKICPRNIIKLTNAKPIWKTPQCEQCLACLHRCPVSAIEYGKSAGRGRYVNPNVKF